MNIRFYSSSLMGATIKFVMAMRLIAHDLLRTFGPLNLVTAMPLLAFIGFPNLK